MFKNVEKLMNFMVVCEEPGDEKLKGVMLEIFPLLQRVRLEVALYLTELMGNEPFYFDLVYPFETICMSNTDNKELLEIVMLPCGTFSMNVIEKLLADVDNPVMQILNYFEFNSRGLRNIMAMHGVSGHISLEMLKEHKILDVLSLHSCVNIYEGAVDTMKGLVE